MAWRPIPSIITMCSVHINANTRARVPSAKGLHFSAFHDTHYKGQWGRWIYRLRVHASSARRTWLTSEVLFYFPLIRVCISTPLSTSFARVHCVTKFAACMHSTFHVRNGLAPNLFTAEATPIKEHYSEPSDFGHRVIQRHNSLCRNKRIYFT